MINVIFTDGDGNRLNPYTSAEQIKYKDTSVKIKLKEIEKQIEQYENEE